MTRTREEMQAVRVAFREWLEGFAWDHFCTLTFTDGCSDAFARQAFNRFARQVEHSAGSPISWFWVLERGASRAMPHLHALLGGTARLPVRSIDGHWRVGLRRVRKYDQRRSAASYVTKRILDDMTDYDVSELLRRKVPVLGDQ